MKSLWYSVDAEPCGHSVQRLVIEFPQPESLPDREQWIEHGALLDNFYIPARYPNGLPVLTPGEVSRLSDAQRGLEAACQPVEKCREWLEQRLSAMG